MTYEQTYAEFIANHQHLISALHVAQQFAAKSGLAAAAGTISTARLELTRDMDSARRWADENMAHGQEVA